MTIFKRQGIHVLLLAVLLAGLFFLTKHGGMQAGALWGVPTPVWFWLAVIMAISHQVYVWFCWRMQLVHSRLTRTMGKYAFPIYAAGFTILGIARVAVVFCLAISNQNTLPLDTLLLKILPLISLVPALYLFYSVKRFFGFKRALGIDHFDPSYRSVPFVREGIFRFSGNAMYVYGFFLLWVPAFWYASLAAVAIAAFNHIYIWVHYYTTELPDIRYIYDE